MIPHDVCQAQFDDWRSLMTVSECPQCVPPEKLSMQCQHRRVSGDQEDSGDSLRDLRGEVSSPMADLRVVEDSLQRLRHK